MPLTIPAFLRRQQTDDHACQVRAAKTSDRRAILAIDAFASVPWPAHMLEAVLNDSVVRALVAERGGQTVGFAAFVHKESHVEMIRFGVRPDHRRNGVGRSLVGSVKANLIPGLRPTLVSRVPEYNLAAHLFLRAEGFRWTRTEECECRCGKDVYRFEWGKQA
jgi:ribosomal protein S18 acetylase RimI-like enzyme